MMFRSLFVIFLSSLVIGAPAQAKRADLGIGVNETLTFVAPITGLDGPAPALCKRQRQHYAFGAINIWATTDFVMSANACTGSDYFALTPAALKNAINQRLIPNGSAPAIRLQDRLLQSWGLVVLALTLLVIVLRQLIRGRLRGRITDNFPKAHQKLIIAMATAANADGKLEVAELETIHEMINRLSYREYSQDEVRSLILATEPVKTDSQIRKLGKGLLNGQKLAILKAAHAVCGADSAQCSAEDGFLLRLANGLKLPSPEIQAVLSR